MPSPTFARHLRQNQTDAELKLWQQLRAHRLLGLKFRRQKPLGPYIVDFVCHERMLVLELDGSQHLDSAGDAVRDRWLMQKGFRVLRFWNHQVLMQTDEVLEAIRLAAESPSPLAPAPRPGHSACRRCGVRRGEACFTSSASPQKGEGNDCGTADNPSRRRNRSTCNARLLKHRETRLNSAAALPEGRGE